ncbi:MAG: lysophospholipid acyltransferase family protein [Oscillospiraceae bacterium]|nr:putative uncharacterized protein [Firmicutes bacterium CAG:129]
MKIKVVDMPYEQALAQPREKHTPPRRPSMLFRTLLRALSAPDLRATHFRCDRVGMERLGPDEPCLVLMNHSCFLDLKITAAVLYPRPFNIVCTSDGFVGKAGLMRALGCIPTRKFQPDTALVRDMLYAVKKLKSSILLYPEASYSFDGTATPLPESLGKCVKALGVPIVLLRTCGAFARDPLYNGLQNRRVNVSAELRYLLSPEEAAEKSADEINALLADEFSFDNFRWQQENGIVVNEPFRADGLNRVLYKCPHCGTEGETEGRGTELICRDCGVRYRLTELGALECENAETKFTHVPDWYAWERACVREELEQGSYLLDAPVSICVMVNFRQICRVGEGRLRHDVNGFRLTGCGGKLDFTQKPETSYSLYADYFWYELGDMICIGDRDVLYYCFPQGKGDVVAKTRLAAEELYKLKRAERAAKNG